MAKNVTIYPNGMGRNGQRHLTKTETAVELYKIAFQVDGKNYTIWPSRLRVTLGGERYGARLDHIIADLLKTKHKHEKEIAKLKEKLLELTAAK